MNTLLWKRQLGKLLPVKSSKNRKLILIYHAVGTTSQALSENAFQMQIEWLKKNTIICSLSELLDSSDEERVQVAISFDDGYGCLYDKVAPILEKKRVSAIVYINTGWISETGERNLSNSNLGHYPEESFLTWGEVKELYTKGWEIGSHGVNHFDLTQLDCDLVKNELAQSKKIIEEKLGSECQHFAYTWGKHSKKLREQVALAGYQYAVAAHHSAIDKNKDNFSLPRMNIEKVYSLEDFESIIFGKWDYLRYIQRMKQWI